MPIAIIPPPAQWSVTPEFGLGIVEMPHYSYSATYSGQAGTQAAAAQNIANNPRFRDTFRCWNQVDIDFIAHVYNPYQACLGEEIRHSVFTVTPETATETELEIIRAMRATCGLTDNPRNIFDAVPSPVPSGGRLRRKLPREPVEALPLPG